MTELDLLRRYDASSGLVGLTSCPDTLDALARAFVSDANVLVTGETGVGKGVLAERIHRCSSRRRGPLHSFHAKGRPPEMNASTLFGTHPGAFTGAPVNGARGLLDLSRGGTLVLDDIHALDEETKALLLHCCQTDPNQRFVQRIGPPPGDRIERVSVDVRFVATTTEDLLARPGWDQLHARLAQICVEVPPLRERPLEIRPLSILFVRKYRRQGEWLSEDAVRALRGYSWPRNVRQLENAMISALASCESDGRSVIEKADLPREILDPSEETPVTGATEIPDPVWDRLRAEERTLVWHWPRIAPALRDSRSRNGKINWAEAGRLLNRWRVPVSPVQLQRKLKPRLARLCRFSSVEEVLSMSSLDLAKTFLNVQRDR